MQFSSPHFIKYKSLVFGDEFQELFNLQGVTPYLPDRKDKGIFGGIKENEKDPVTVRYMKKVLNYDIENEHIIKNRDKLKNPPIGIRWTKEELDRFNSLSDVKEKRAMILEKSELKSVYIPHLKWDKKMIKYPNLPHDAKSKSDFEKGYKLYNEGKYDEAVPLLKGAYKNGNYIAAQLLATIYLERLKSDKFSANEVEDWLVGGLENNSNIKNEHDKIIENISTIAQNLINKGLPVGYFLMAEIYYHYLQTYSDNYFDTRFRANYIKYLMKAANSGSYDAYMRLAINDADLEWLLCAMIVSHDYKCFDIFAKSINSRFQEYASPRNLAIVRLAAMWGSNYAMDCLTYGETGNFISTFNHLILDAFPNGAIYMPNSEIAYRRDIYNKYYGKDKGVFEGVLIPDLDTVYPPKPVIYSPYNMTPVLHYFIEDHPNLTHPLAPNSTEKSMIEFREELRTYEEITWINKSIVESTQAYQSSKYSNDARKNMAMIEFEDIDKLFGYLNVIKLRELEQNPLYYPSGRIFIYPESFYKKHPDWY